MLKNLEARKIVFDNELIDRTFFTEKDSPAEFFEPFKAAKRIYLRSSGKKWNVLTLKKLIKFFKDKEVISSGVVAVPHNTKKGKYTQYCSGLICKSKGQTFKVDIDFYIYWNSDYTRKK